VRRASVQEYAAAVRPRYQRGSKSEWDRILDAFCEATGYHRVYARALLREPGAAAAPAPRHGRPRRYGPAEIRLLQACSAYSTLTERKARTAYLETATSAFALRATGDHEQFGALRSQVLGAPASCAVIACHVRVSSI
jgi:hypothetical protein